MTKIEHQQWDQQQFSCSPSNKKNSELWLLITFLLKLTIIIILVIIITIITIIIIITCDNNRAIQLLPHRIFIQRQRKPANGTEYRNERSSHIPFMRGFTRQEITHALFGNNLILLSLLLLLLLLVLLLWLLLLLVLLLLLLLTL